MKTLHKLTSASLRLIFLLCPLLFGTPLSYAENPYQATQDLPIAWNGRFSSMESASRLWLYDIYHKQKLKSEELKTFHVDDPSALNLLWLMHFYGHTSWDNSPLFWIHYADLKSALSLQLTQERFSFNTLFPKLENPLAASGRILDESQQLSQRLRSFADYKGGHTTEESAYEKLLADLLQKQTPPEEIARMLESRFPLSARLRSAGTTLKMLPLRAEPGEWVSLHALTQQVYSTESQRLVPVSNFTSFSDRDFGEVRDAYLALKQSTGIQNALVAQAAADFSAAYEVAYRTLVGRPYKQASEKALYYPSEIQLKAETFYYRIPLVEMTIICYALFLLLILLPSRFFPYAMTTLCIGLALHTALLALRCYILQRPPVSNMFETVVYVPWIALIMGAVFYVVSRSKIVLTCAAFTSLALLVLLKLTQVDARMENVQAVLDSQYWLIIHVLMIVGSYGAFAVCGILAHFYLIKSWIVRKSPDAKEKTAEISRGILYTMYLGVALLIPGTILGGVWAAESWGRFWDWDPKEAWAFITACVYLLVIHAYTFHRIRNFGLAIGAVAGLLAVSFTWYGVNYVLGTGLHSYGFGKGGESFYFIYVGAECLFLVTMIACTRRIFGQSIK